MQEPRRHHATADLDIAAIVSRGALEPAVSLDVRLTDAVADIAGLHGLSPAWINAAVAHAFGIVLPDGFLERATKRTFGSLTLRVASRIDLLRLKSLAALRRGAPGRRQLQDVRRAAPDRAELDEVERWLREQRPDVVAFGERIDQLMTELRADVCGG